MNLREACYLKPRLGDLIFLEKNLAQCVPARVTSTETLAATPAQEQHTKYELKRNKNQLQSIHRPE